MRRFFYLLLSPLLKQRSRASRAAMSALPLGFVSEGPGAARRGGRVRGNDG